MCQCTMIMPVGVSGMAVAIAGVILPISPPTRPVTPPSRRPLTPACSGDTWRTLRLAWQPAFSSDSLEGYSDLMDTCAKHLAEVRGGLFDQGWPSVLPTYDASHLA